MPRLTIGLTGGVASGKSIVGDQFAALGVPVADGDQVARDVVEPGSSALDQIARNFGRQFLDESGVLNRRMMREHIFGDETERHKLEAILHPLIADRLQEWRDARTEPYCIISVAILLESGMDRLVNRVLVVDAPVEMQLARLATRDGVSASLARSMLEAQIPRETRLQRAHDVIDNSGTHEQTRDQVDRLHKIYLRIASPDALSAICPDLK